MSRRRLATFALFAALVVGRPAAAQDFPSLDREWLKECQDVAARPICRVKRTFSADAAAQRLDGKDLAWWAEGDTFNVLAVHRGDALRMCCAIQAPMARLPGTDFWALSVRVAELDRAVLDISPMRGGRMPYPPVEWRGPSAPAKLTVASPLAGKIVNETVNSRHLGAARQLSIYLPPGYQSGQRYRVIYAADGAGTSGIAAAIEPLVVAGWIPPTLIVGIHSGESQQRALDYLRNFTGHGDAAFERHERFVLTEVLPLAEQRYGASPRREDRMLAGQSNGAAWALSTALRHSNDFGHAAVLSFAWPQGAQGMGGKVRPRLYFAAGSLEGSFLRRTREAAHAASAAGHDVQLHIGVSGHAYVFWRDHYAAAAEWAFGRSR